MPELTELKPNKLNFTFIPRPAGIGVLAVIVAAFVAGALRRELVLTLTGAVFLTIWVYCLLMTLLLAFIHRRRACRASIRVSPREISTGETVQIIYSEGNAVAPNRKILQLPGVLTRCLLFLSTRDGRVISRNFSPVHEATSFTAEKRGAYFSLRNEFAVFDILGFFHFAYRLSLEDGAAKAASAQLLVSPRAAAEPPSINARAGDSSLQPEFSFQRTDNLVDHRPYIPGDDPRRINWKLYGHGGGLFVREGEREPPPHSNIAILIDTEYDPLLYNARAARHGVDLLCENALAAAIACTESGMDVVIGFSHQLQKGAAQSTVRGTVYGGKAKELASALALPAALCRHPLTGKAETPPELPLTTALDNRGILILALPHTDPEYSSLNRFLNKTLQANESHRKIDVVFFCNGDRGQGTDNSYAKRLAAAAACAALYSRRPGVSAKSAGI